MKVPALAASYFAGVDAVTRCPLFAEKGWKLVRRTTDDSFSNGDLMAGTMSFGIESSHRLADSFAIDHSSFGWDEVRVSTCPI